MESLRFGGPSGAILPLVRGRNSSSSIVLQESFLCEAPWGVLYCLKEYSAVCVCVCSLALACAFGKNPEDRRSALLTIGALQLNRVKVVLGNGVVVE